VLKKREKRVPIGVTEEIRERFTVYSKSSLRKNSTMRKLWLCCK